jgi:hypothetical protein
LQKCVKNALWSPFLAAFSNTPPDHNRFLGVKMRKTGGGFIFRTSFQPKFRQEKMFFFVFLRILKVDIIIKEEGGGYI